MHALAVLLALAALAASAAPAAAEVDEDRRLQRLHAGVGYPGPGLDVRVFEHPDCVFHQVLWEGGWSTLAGATVWTWEGGSPARAGELKEPLQRTTFLAALHAAGWVVTALEQWPAWNDELDLAVQWAAGTVGDEDVCALGLVEVTTGL